MRIEKGRASLDQKTDIMLFRSLKECVTKGLRDELHIRDVLKGNCQEPPFVSS